MEPTAPPWFDMAARRVCTIEAAQAALPAIRAQLQTGRREMRRTHELKDLVEDLRAYYGDAVDTDANPERSRYQVLVNDLAEAQTAVEGAVQEIHRLGGELKDIDRGLVDFCGVRDGTIVYLCWEDGEDRIEFWHPLETGYAGREPL